MNYSPTYMDIFNQYKQKYPEDAAKVADWRPARPPYVDKVIPETIMIYLEGHKGSDFILYRYEEEAQPMKCKYYKPYMETLYTLAKHFYDLEDCAAGGPLHVLLDDDNYDSESIRYCLVECLKGLKQPDWVPTMYSKTVYILGAMICNEYAKMSLEERAAFDSYWCGSPLECDGNCDDCPCNVFDEVYEHMKEAEEAAHEERQLRI